MKLRKVTKSASSATLRKPGVEYTRHSQTLCMACQRRVQWNGDRWIHLVVYARGLHEARPDLDLIVDSADSSDPWAVEKLTVIEAAERA